MALIIKGESRWLSVLRIKEETKTNQLAIMR